MAAAVRAMIRRIPTLPEGAVSTVIDVPFEAMKPWEAVSLREATPTRAPRPPHRRPGRPRAFGR
jgi:hypothetical protein